MLPVIGLCSRHDEGLLGDEAVKSLWPACDDVYIADGPIDPDADEWSGPGGDPNHGFVGCWRSDADKRTDLLRIVQRDMGTSPFWAVWIDGDETMQWADRLRIWLQRAEQERDEHGDLKATGGFPLRLVELDGTTVQCLGRVIRGDIVDHYVHSIVEVRLKGQATSLVLANIPNWAPGEEETGMLRRPLQGEPHYLHLSALRDPAREAERQSEAEQRGYKERAASLGLALPDWAA